MASAATRTRYIRIRKGHAVNLYLMRHAHALDVGEGNIRRDSERPLSRKGEDITQHMARQLNRSGVKLDLIATSPLLRAKQTAEIIAKGLGHVPVDLCLDLSPAAGTATLPSSLPLDEMDSVMLVGHMPDLCELASTLIFGKPSHGVSFKKAAICKISFAGRCTAGHGTLEWLLTPAMILS